jgi:hypothetical protein
MIRILSCLPMVFTWGVALAQTSSGLPSTVWSGSWEDPLLEKSIRCTGEVEQAADGSRTVSLYGWGWHEGGHDCHVTLIDDSTGLSGHCPVFDEYRGGTTRVGIRHVAGEKLLVHLGEGDEWLNWVGPEPAWRMGQPWPLFELWRALAGEWEPVGDPMAHRLQFSGQRCEVKWRKGWTPLNMLFEEYDVPVRDAVRIEGEGAFRVVLQGDRLTWTKLKDVGAEYDVVQWEETDEVTEFRRVSSMALAPFKGLLGMHPELSLSTVNRKQLDRSPGELRRMRNEIFARHGWRFKSEDLAAHFGDMDGYIPVEDNATVQLSAVEAFNANRIRERETALRASLPERHDPEVRFGMEWAQFEEAGLDPAQSADGTGRHWMVVQQDGRFAVVHARLLPQAEEDVALFRGVKVDGMDARVVATFNPGPCDPDGIRHVDFPRSVEQGESVQLGADRFVSRIVQRGEDGIYHQLQFQRVAPDGRFTGGQSEATWLEFAHGLEWAGDFNGDGRTDFILTGSRKSSVTRFQFWLSNPMTGALELVADRELTGC